ncbi:MAG: lipopolysaccharide core heptose(I) kinase RfaP [Lentisphaeria bacterium]|nr:lipopolysaccharide core heptose(I) kinase RfaP [Lentisphaeria bacterium]
MLNEFRYKSRYSGSWSTGSAKTVKKLFLSEFFQKLWQDSEPFAEVGKLDGTLFREVKTRRTLRLELGGRSFFLKHHLGVGWKEIFKNLFQFKLPILGAGNEFAAINALTALDVPTMTAEAYGERGLDPAKRESFLITAELCDNVSLEDICRDWAANPPAFKFKYALLKEVARSSSIMHDNNICHRDCYICHFLLDMKTRDAERPLVSVIDLHRALIWKKLPFRYRVKDTAGLYFSSMDAGLSRRDFYRFMKLYSHKSLRETLQSDKKFWQAVDKTARKLYLKDHKKAAPEF